MEVVCFAFSDIEISIVAVRNGIDDYLFGREEDYIFTLVAAAYDS